MALLVAFMGCGDGNGGGGGGTAPEPVSLTGTWNYNATNLSGTIEGIPITCDVLGARVSLVQTNAQLSGQTLAGGTVSCTADGEEFSEPVTEGGEPVFGSISGNSVILNIVTTDWTNTGTLQGANTITGTVSAFFVIEGFELTLSGSFSMTR
jgi:hypothetical protein